MAVPSPRWTRSTTSQRGPNRRWSCWRVRTGLPACARRLERRRGRAAVGRVRVQSSSEPRRCAATRAGRRRGRPRRPVAPPRPAPAPRTGSPPRSGVSTTSAPRLVAVGDGQRTEEGEVADLEGRGRRRSRPARRGPARGSRPRAAGPRRQRCGARRGTTRPRSRQRAVRRATPLAPSIAPVEPRVVRRHRLGRRRSSVDHARRRPSAAMPTSFHTPQSRATHVRRSPCGLAGLGEGVEEGVGGHVVDLADGAVTVLVDENTTKRSRSSPAAPPRAPACRTPSAPARPRCRLGLATSSRR